MNEGPSNFRVGRYRIVEPISQGRFQSWYLAVREGEAAEVKGGKVRLLVVNDERFSKESEWRSHSPSLSNLQRQAALSAPQLLAIEEVVREPHRIAIAVEATEFRDWFDPPREQTSDPEPANRAIVELARAVKTLHDAKLIHGRLASNWILRRATGSLCLLRDPLFEPRNPLSKRCSSFAFDNATLAREYFVAAPEFVLSRQRPNVATDLFALGCIWVRLLSGKWPFLANDIKGLMEAHTTQPLSIDAKWGLSPLQMRCLQHLSAKNPSDRFASIDDFLQAMTGADSPSVPPPAMDVAPVSQAVTVPPIEPPVAAEFSFDSLNSLNKGKLNKGKKQTRTKPKSVGWKSLVAVVGCLILLAGGVASLFFVGQGGNKSVAKESESSLKPGVAKASETPSREGNANSEEGDNAAYRLVDRDEVTLWMPPLASEPCSLDLFPPGADGFLFLRLESLTQSTKLKATVDLFAAELQPFWQWLTEASGFPPDAIRRLGIAFYGGEPGNLRWALRLELRQPMALAELQQGWGGADRVQEAGPGFFQGKTYAYYVGKHQATATDRHDVFVMGKEDLIREVADLEGGVAPLRHQLEQLWQQTDSLSEINLLFVPSLVENEARQPLTTVFPEFYSTLRKLFGTPWQACSFRLAVGEKLFLEMRGASSSEKESGKAVQNWKEVFQSLADQAEQRLQQSEIHPYWRPIALRLPQMMRSVVKLQRFGVEHGQGISNLYLPLDALPNLSLAALYAGKGSNGSTAKEVDATVNSEAKSLSLEEVLALPIDLRFEQQSFENAVRSVLEEINAALPPKHPRLTIEIDGKAFEQEGITRNKEVRGFQFQKQPGRKALNDLILKSNPDPSPGLQFEKQKVVWVDNGPQAGDDLAILITTRKGADILSKTLPPEFHVKETSE